MTKAAARANAATELKIAGNMRREALALAACQWRRRLIAEARNRIAEARFLRENRFA